MAEISQIGGIIPTNGTITSLMVHGWSDICEISAMATGGFVKKVEKNDRVICLCVVINLKCR